MQQSRDVTNDVTWFKHILFLQPFLARFPKNAAIMSGFVVRHSFTPSLCHTVGAVTRERSMIESSKLRQMIAIML
jgi:hypothetical protein